ncbi:MAG: pitrilysin family protein [Acidobacteriota bacterium]
MKKITPLAFAVVLLLSLTSSIHAGIAEVRRAKLKNGLEVILIENPGSLVVSSSVFIRAGVSTENPGMNGASHLLEHLLFNGTERRTQKELYDETDFYGMNNNAFTREDYTCFQMIVPSHYLEKGFDIQSDMLFHSTMPEENFEKEKKIVLEEIGKDRGNPDYLAELFFIGKTFEGTPYSKPVLGTTESITAMKRDGVFRYYKEYYVPNNMILFLIGDFHGEEALKMIERYFGSVSTAKFKEIAIADFPWKREKNLFRGKLGTGRNYLDIVTEAPDLSSQDFHAFQILISTLSEGEDSRLYKILMAQEQPLVLDFSLNHATYGGKGFLRFSATLPENGVPEKAAEAYLQELQRAATEGITEEEIEEGKKDLKVAEIYQGEQFHYYSMIRGEWITFGGPGFLGRYLETIGKQDAVSVNEAAKKYWSNPSPIVTIVGPGQKDGATARWESPVYQTSAVPVSGEEVRKEVLDNGMTIIVRRDRTSEIFALHLLMKNRSANEPEGKMGIADFTHRMLLKGNTLMDSADISEAMKGIGARIKVVDDPFIPYDDYYTTQHYSYIRFETLPENHRKGLKLLKEIVFHPSFPESEMGKVAAEMKDLIGKNEEKVSSRARNQFLSKAFEGSYLGNSIYGRVDSISFITSDDLASFHRKYFSPHNIIVSIVSDLPVEDVLREMKEIFGDLQRHEGEVLGTSAVQPTMKSGRLEIKGGKEQSYIYAGYLFRVEETDIPALTIANALLSDRMAFHLREKLGMAYAVGSSISYYGDTGLFLASMGTRPDNVEDAVQGILGVIDSLDDSKLADREVEKTVNSMIGRAVMRRIPGINRAYFMGLSEFQGRGYDFDLESIKRMKEVDVDAVKKAAGRYLSTSNIIVIVAK